MTGYSAVFTSSASVAHISPFLFVFCESLEGVYYSLKLLKGRAQQTFETIRGSILRLSSYSAIEMFLYCHLVCLLLAFEAIDALDNSAVNSRTKRSLSTKDLVLELMHRMIIEEKQDLAKADNSVSILQRDSCTNIKSIGKPVIHNARDWVGAWMKDPLGIMGTETIFVMDGYHDRRELEEYENMNMLKAGLARKKYTLPYDWDGTGAVVYGPYLFSNRENSNQIVKYNLRSERLEAQISVSNCAPRSNQYQSGGYNGMDLAVDEQGLWVLCGNTGSKRLMARKINIVKNTITHSFYPNTEPITLMGNAFVACGVIYTLDSYTRSTSINFAYDTKTGRQWNPNIKFTNQYSHNFMVDYNPREKVLYAWDGRYQVTYPITFGEH
ncbi:noelin-like [Montipora capricornis]|uniref:noelin-like n=1 Tax=Montipora capricornis TaxID=246305 RepID=UPI0035F10FC3